MRTFFRTLKTVSVITLIFFCWTYLPLYQIAAYAAINNQVPKGNGTGPTKHQKPEERLEKLLEDIRDNTEKAEKKAAKGEDTANEIESIKARKAEIDAIDTDLKKEFAVTEKKLKAANLPKEILARHNKFVKNYEDNIAELKSNVETIEKAKTPSALTSEIGKTQKHLAKIKPPKKRKPFDPNNLPNRARLVKHATQEEKKPEEKKILPMQPLRKGAKLNPAEEQRKQANRPIIVASNGPLDGLMLPSPQTDVSPWQGAPASDQQFANLTTDSVIMNSIIAAPTIITHPPASAADLAETPEIQFTPAILAKAQELERKPLKIYEWVRNNVEFVPTYGSIQGADMCLQTKQCNDVDTASLLIALLRASNVSARYVYGTIELPIEKAKNWLGGVTDPTTVGTILATNGIPAKVLISGGTITAVQLDHVYVSAFIDMIPSRGAVHKEGDTWVPLDPSFKQYTYTQGIDVAAAVPFDAQSFANQIQTTATINSTDGSVTNVNSSLIQQTMQGYQTQVQNYIQQNYPNATVGDVIGKKEIKKHEFPIFMGTLPYKTVQISSEFAQVPDNLRETIIFSIPDSAGASNGLSYTTSLPQIAGKKITLSFSPATTADQAVIESYLPTPHSDGTPIQSSELPSSLPAYLINLKPELRIDGQVVATGSPIAMGSALSFTMSLNEAGIGMSNIDNDIQAGEYYGIGLDTGRMADLSTLKTKLDTTKAKIDSLNLSGLSKDDLIGDLLYTTIVAYFTALDVSDEITAKQYGVIRYRAPSVGMFSLLLDVRYVFGMPTSASSKGLLMDVDRIMQTVHSVDGNNDKVMPFMLASGRTSSALEHYIPEKLYSTPTEPAKGISAVKALQIANSQGMPIYTINKSNISAILPQLQVGNDVKSTISDAVNAGKIVTVSKGNISYEGWVGCGYIVIDATTGAGAYLISGHYSGACLILLWAAQLLLTILLPFTAPIWIVLAPILGAFFAVAGQYLINSTVNPNTPVVTGSQLAGVYLDMVVSSILSYAVGLLPLMSLAGPLGLIMFALFMLLIAVVDWVAFFYITYNYDLMRYLARYRTDLKG